MGVRPLGGEDSLEEGTATLHILGAALFVPEIPSATEYSLTKHIVKIQYLHSFLYHKMCYFTEHLERDNNTD